MTLGLLAIFRNEAHALREFIEHYISQGVDRFYLINNASEDDYLEAIGPYARLVHLYQEDHVPDTEFLSGGGKQVEAYNRVLPDIDTDWLIVQDLDEFTYARGEFKSIKDFIDKRGYMFDQYLMHLKPFTSGGVIEQPESIVQGFTEGRVMLKAGLTKPIVRTQKVRQVHINYCTLHSGVTWNATLDYSSMMFTDKPSIDELIKFRAINYEKQFSEHPIKCNHYSVQSFDWYFNVKAKRGTATWHGAEYMPASEWFERRWNELHNVITQPDTELKDLQG